MSHHHSYLVTFWSPFAEPDTEPYLWYFASVFRRYGDIQCLNLKNNQDLRTRSLLLQADLVVIPLRQSHRELCQLICHCDLRLPNAVLLILDYVGESDPTLKDIAVEFRIPFSRLACVPYSPLNRGDGKKTGPVSFPSEVRRELARAGQVILQALGF